MKKKTTKILILSVFLFLFAFNWFPNQYNLGTKSGSKLNSNDPDKFLQSSQLDQLNYIEKWDFAFNITTDSRYFLISPDLNGDGYDDILVSYREQGSSVYNLSLLDHEGNLIWKRNDFQPRGNSYDGKNLRGNDKMSWYYQIYDENGDGTPDILGTFSNNSMGILNGRNGETLWAGQPFGTNNYPIVPMEDFTSDGKPEILMRGDGNNYGILNSSDKTVIWSNTYGYSPHLHVIPDVDGDGIWDVITGANFVNAIHCWSGIDGSNIWSHSIGFDSWGEAICPDQNGDGYYDVLITPQSSQFELINGNDGTTIWGSGYSRSGHPNYYIDNTCQGYTTHDDEGVMRTYYLNNGSYIGATSLSSYETHFLENPNYEPNIFQYCLDDNNEDLLIFALGNYTQPIITIDGDWDRNPSPYYGNPYVSVHDLILMNSTHLVFYTDPLSEYKDDNWWNTHWEFRKKISIDNKQNSQTLNDYIKMIEIPYSDGMNQEFEDLRFINSNGEELEYWIERKTSQNSADIWIKIPQILAYSTMEIDLYYGNSEVSSKSEFLFEFYQNSSLNCNYGSSYENTRNIWTMPGTNKVYAFYTDSGATRKSFYWDGSSWIRDDSAENGMPDNWAFQGRHIYYDEEWGDYMFYTSYIGSYPNDMVQWDGSSWVQNSTIMNGLTLSNDGYRSYLLFKQGDTKNLFIPNYGNYTWDGSQWVANNSIPTPPYYHLKRSMNLHYKFNQSGTIRYHYFPVFIYTNASDNCEVWHFSGTKWNKIHSGKLGAFPETRADSSYVFDFNVIDNRLTLSASTSPQFWSSNLYFAEIEPTYSIGEAQFLPFIDEFCGTLEKGWFWDPSESSYTLIQQPGQFSLQVASNEDTYMSGWDSPRLYREAPNGDWFMETFLQTDAGLYSQTGLLFFESSTRWMTWGFIWDDEPDSNKEPGVGLEGREDGLFNEELFFSAISQAEWKEGVYLRVYFHENSQKYTFAYRKAEETEYTFCGSKTFNWNNLMIGFFCKSWGSNPGYESIYEYFKLHWSQMLLVENEEIELFGTHNYQTVVLQNNGIIHIKPYNGTIGTGTLKLNAAEIFIDESSLINGSGCGYRGGSGGAGGLPNNGGGEGGSNGEGPGGGNGGTDGVTSGGDGGHAGGGAGGGAGGSYGCYGVEGGGGGYGHAGFAVPGGSGGTPTSPYYNYQLNSIQMGSGGAGAGGGGGGGGWPGETGYPGGPGGAGGGSIHLNSDNIYIKGVISVNGDDGRIGGKGGDAYKDFDRGGGGGGAGGGGGSGGGILLTAKKIILSNTSKLFLQGGRGNDGGLGGLMNGHNRRNEKGFDGGNGGGGVLKLNYSQSIRFNGELYLGNGQCFTSQPSSAGSLISPNLMTPIVKYDNLSFIKLNWNEINGAKYYKIYRSHRIFSKINDATLIAISNVSNLMDLVGENGRYYYAIIALNDTHESAPSNIEAISILNPNNKTIWQIGRYDGSYAEYMSYRTGHSPIYEDYTDLHVNLMNNSYWNNATYSGTFSNENLCKPLNGQITGYADSIPGRANPLFFHFELFKLSDIRFQLGVIRGFGDGSTLSVYVNNELINTYNLNKEPYFQDYNLLIQKGNLTVGENNIEIRVSSHGLQYDYFKLDYVTVPDNAQSGDFYVKYNMTWTNDYSENMRESKYLDLDGDGVLELIRYTENYVEDIYKWNGDGYQWYMNFSGKLGELGDFDGDGREEIWAVHDGSNNFFFYDIDLNRKQFTLEYEWNHGFSRRGGISYGDLEHDNKKEISYFNEDGIRRIYSFNGDTFVQNASFDYGGFAYTPSCIMIDLDGDDRDEIVCGWGYSSDRNGDIYIYEDYTDNFNYITHFNFERDPHLLMYDDHEDLNGDGQVDLIVGIEDTFVDKYRYIISYNASQGNYQSSPRFTRQTDRPSSTFGAGKISPHDSLARYISFHTADGYDWDYTNQIYCYEWNGIQFVPSVIIDLGQTLGDRNKWNLELRDINNDGFDEIIWDGNDGYGKQATFIMVNREIIGESSSFCDDTYPPTWDETPSNQSFEYGNSFYYDVNATDLSGIRNYWINDTGRFSVNSLGEITNASILELGEYWINISAFDPFDNYCNAQIKITISDISIPTWIESPTNQIQEYGNSFYYDVNATDMLGITEYQINDTINFIINSDGEITNNSFLSVNDYCVNVSAFDGDNHYCDAQFIIKIVDTTSPQWIETPKSPPCSRIETFYYDVNATDLSGIDHYTLNDTVNFQINSDGLISNNTILSGGEFWINVSAFDPYDNFCYSLIYIPVFEIQSHWKSEFSTDIISVTSGYFNNDNYIDVALRTQRDLIVLDGISGDRIWTHSLGTPLNDIWRDIRYDIVSTDLNGDGFDDVITFLFSPRGLYAFNGKNGSILWYDSNSGDTQHKTPCIGDFDGDGIKDEVISGAGWEESYIRAYDGDGTILWTYNGLGGMPLEVCDINGDGYDDVYVNYGWPDNKIYAINFSGSLLFSISQDGYLFKPANLDGDITKEIIISSPNSHFIEAWDDDDSKIWEINPLAAPISSMETAEITGDNIDDIIITTEEFICALEGGTFNLLWNISMNFRVFEGPNEYTIFHNDIKIDDINSDGKLEVLTVNDYGQFMILNALTGEILDQISVDFGINYGCIKVAKDDDELIFYVGNAEGSLFKLKLSNFITNDVIPPNWVDIPGVEFFKVGCQICYDVNATDVSGIVKYWINDTIQFRIDDQGVIQNLTTLIPGVYWIKIRAYDASLLMCEHSFKIVVYLEGNPEIFEGGWNYHSSYPYDSSIFRVNYSFNLIRDTTIVCYSSITNPSQININNALLYMEIMTNDSSNIREINLNIEYLGPNSLQNIGGWWFNESSGAWEQITITYEGNSIFISIEHASIFAISGEEVYAEYEGEEGEGEEENQNKLGDENHTIIIIIIIIIGSVSVFSATTFYLSVNKKMSKQSNNIETKNLSVETPSKAYNVDEENQPTNLGNKEKPIKSELESEPKITAKENLQAKERDRMSTKIKPKKKPQKKLSNELTTEKTLKKSSHSKLEELKKTEAELDIEENLVKCIVHRGPIHGNIYLCKSCQAFYCDKCAKVLQMNRENCWACGEEIDVDFEENEDKNAYKKDMGSLLEAIMEEEPAIKEYLHTDKTIEQIPELEKVLMTILSKKTLTQLSLMDIDREEKKQFLKEILVLSPKERENLLSELLNTNN